MARIRMRRHGRGERRGAVAVELAVVAPLLVFLLLIAVDFARVFYTSLTLANCARNGALFESDVYVRAESQYGSTQDAALADAGNLLDPNNPVKVTTGSGFDENGRPYIEVTCRQRFRTVSRFPGIPDDVDLTRTVRMARAPLNPTN